MSKFNIGIIGLGYVGGAIYNAIPEADTYDKNPDINVTCNSMAQLVERVELIYVCVPTPATKYGECDTSIVESVVDEIALVASNPKIIVIKSTVPPGTTKRLQEKYSEHHILFSPEFLTEANYKDDYLNQSMMLVGYSGEEHRSAALTVMTEQCMRVKTLGYGTVVDATTAELYKYVANNFLATKVSFANEMRSIADKIGVDWKDISYLAKHDDRLGKSHWKVPGPDGHFGFGGTCLPKDLSAMIHFASKNFVPVPLLTAVESRNIRKDRPERDWENLKGRAVSE